MALTFPTPDAVSGRAEGCRQMLTALNVSMELSLETLPSQDRKGEKVRVTDKQKLGKGNYCINKNAEGTLEYQEYPLFLIAEVIL